MSSGMIEILPSQVHSPVTPTLQAAVEALANATDNDARGAVFTRPEVVDFILDLVGYTPDQPLYEYRLLEPSFGNGDFLLAAVTRLLAACRQARLREEVMLPRLAGAIRGVELHHETFRATKGKLACLLADAGLPAARRLSAFPGVIPATHPHSPLA